MTREEKLTAVAEYEELLSSADCALFVDLIGLTVQETTQLRRRVRESGARIRQVKNTLCRLALAHLGREEALPLVSGPTAIAVSYDPTLLSKVLYDLGALYEDRLKLRGGWLSGRVLDRRSVVELAQCPPLPGMRAKALGVLTAPMAGLLRLLNEAPASLLRVMAARAQKEGAD